jgi:hypothetical protein
MRVATPVNRGGTESSLTQFGNPKGFPQVVPDNLQHGLGLSTVCRERRRRHAVGTCRASCLILFDFLLVGSSRASRQNKGNLEAAYTVQYGQTGGNT